MNNTAKAIITTMIAMTAACSNVTNHDAAQNNIGAKTYSLQGSSGNAAVIEKRYKPEVKFPKDKLQEHIQELFADSAVTKADVRLEPVTWATSTQKFANTRYTEDSQVWAVTVDGDLLWPFAAGVDQKRAQGRKMYLTFATDTGALLAAYMPN